MRRQLRAEYRAGTHRPNATLTTPFFSAPYSVSRHYNREVKHPYLRITKHDVNDGPGPKLICHSPLQPADGNAKPWVTP